MQIVLPRHCWWSILAKVSIDSNRPKTFDADGFFSTASAATVRSTLARLRKARQETV